MPVNTLDSHSVKKTRKTRTSIAKSVRKIFFTILALVAIFFTYMLWLQAVDFNYFSKFSSILASITPGGSFPVNLENSIVNSMGLLGNDVVVCTDTANYIYNRNGVKLYVDINTFSNPITKISGHKLLTYDIGGYGIKQVTNTGSIFSYFTQDRILAADASQSGHYAVAVLPNGSLTKVTLYDSKQRWLYAWDTSAGYATDIALADDAAYMAVGLVSASNSTISSAVAIHYLKKEAEPFFIELENELIASMVWRKDGNLQIVTDRRILLFSEFGKAIAATNLPKNTGVFLNSENGFVFATVYDTVKDITTIYAYDYLLRETGSNSLSGNISTISESNGKLLLLASGDIYLTNTQLNELQKRNHSGYTNILFVNNYIYAVSKNRLEYLTL